MDTQEASAIDQAIEVVTASAKKAGREYDRRASEIKRLSSKQIQLGVGTAVGKVSDIAEKVRKANDEYYTTLQTLVKVLDDQCRPLLALDSDPLAIRRVYKTLKWLNDESEINATFSAGVNGVSRGKVAQVSYAPTLDSKLIEKFWETQYEMHPGRAAAEKREREEEKARQNAVKEGVKRKNEELAAAYEEQLNGWKVKRDEILQKRESELQKELAKLKADRKADVEKRHKDGITKANNAITFNSNAQKGHERKLEKLGFFAFGKKKEEKESIRLCIEGIEEARSRLENAESLYKKELAQMDDWVKEQKSALEERLKAKYPMPKKPRKQSTYTDPQKTVDESIRQEIYDFMKPGVRYTVKELNEQIFCLADLLPITVQGHLRAMVGVELERIEERDCAYFRLIEE